MLTLAPAALAIALAAGAAPADGPEPLRRGDIPIAVVLSGGVSLGAYEAGLAWAMVRFSGEAAARSAEHGLGAPRLVAVTGASAGGINALLSAALWCVEPAAAGDVGQNLFRDVWLPVGFDALLPDDGTRYEPGDALLSTRPLVAALDELQAWLAQTGRRLRPGCRLPLGITVTRAEAAEHEVAGLTVRTQRLAVPWRLEVGADGAARVVPQRLGAGAPRSDLIGAFPADPQGPGGGAVSWPQVGQSVLASAAFPAFFRARELCECTPRCPAAHRVHAGSCEAPRGRMTGLSCPARSPEGDPLFLCAHRYVDGGIFDNTPVGLGVDLTEAVFAPGPLQPVTYVYVDPDLRRLAPAREEDAARRAPAGENLEGTARLLSELVATGRAQDLTRAMQRGVWAATTRSLLYDVAASLVTFSAAARRLSGEEAPPDAPGVALPRAIPGPADRDAIGRALLRCELDRAPSPAAMARCLRAVEDAAAGRAAAAGPPLADEELVALAEDVGRSARSSVGARVVTPDEGVAPFDAEAAVGVWAILLLADETPRLARSALPEPRLRQLRAALLDTVQLGRTLALEAARRANRRVLAQLARLPPDAALAAAAARAATAIRAAPDALFLADDLQPVLDALARAAPGGDAAKALRTLAAAGPALQAEIVRLNRLAAAADALGQSRTERVLVLTSRFAPITGSHLRNFGAFVDRPFREYDYAAGVYDAAHVAAVALCAATAVPGAPSPIRDPGAPGQLDLAAPDSQRCVGAALGAVRHDLAVDRSPTVGAVFRMLARAELDATLDADAAGAIRAEPTWSWLGTPLPAPDPEVAAVARVLLSPGVPCGPGARARCIRELSFDELRDGLRAQGYRGAGPGMQALLEDPEGWERRMLQKLLDRSLERERAVPGSPEIAPAVRLAHGVGEMWLRRPTGSGPLPRLELDPSTIPARTLAPSMVAAAVFSHLVPYRLDLDLARGGVAASWLDPVLWLGRRASVQALLSPVAFDPHGDRASSIATLLPTLHLSRISLGAGPRASVRWSDGSGRVGASVRASVLQDRLSLEVGTSTFPVRSSDVHLLVGFGDLNGAFFWLVAGP